MVSFQSKFAHDIEKMREWRETLGYAVDSYDGYLVQFDRYCGAFFPDADILTWDIAPVLLYKQNVNTVMPMWM